MNKNTNKSLLISIEGIDGSGKSTLIKKLTEKIPNSFATQSPRGTELGKKVWDLVTENLVSKDLITNAWTEFFLFTANHNEHVLTIINPNLEAGRTILTDRYLDSTLVYQGVRGKLPINKLIEIWEKTISIPFPDLTFILDIEPNITKERVSKRRQETGEEPNNWDKSKLDFHQKIRNGYLELKKFFPERIYIVDAGKNEEEVWKEVWDIIQEREKEVLPSLARVAVENEKGEILVVKDKKWGWNFPGGRIETGESSEQAAYREVFEETNLIVSNLELMSEEDIFFANLEKGNHWWKGYFYWTDSYSGKIKIKEAEKILDIKFVDYHSAEAQEARKSYRKFFKNYADLKKQKEINQAIPFVRVIIENDKGKLLLLKEKKWGEDWWGLPGGKVEVGETPETAAKREVFEETNLVVENLEKLTKETIYFEEKGKNQQAVGHFFWTNKYSGEIQNKESNKILDISFFDYESTEVNENKKFFFHSPDDFSKTLALIRKRAKIKSFARVAIQNKEGKFLLVKNKKGGWNFPGGKVENNENPLEAAKREILEEINLKVENLEKIAENIFLINDPWINNQEWRGYFYQTANYFGELTNNEPAKISAIKFFEPPEILANPEVNPITKIFFQSLNIKIENKL